MIQTTSHYKTDQNNMRHISFPFLLLDEYKNRIEGDIAINPFSIDAYYSDVVDYVQNGMNESANITTIHTRNGRVYELFITIEEFEKRMKEFMEQ